MREIKKAYVHKNKYRLHDLIDNSIYEFSYRTELDLQIETLKEDYKKVKLIKKSKYVYEVTYSELKY